MCGFPFLCEMPGQGAVSRHMEQCTCSRLSVQGIAWYCNVPVNSAND